MNKKQGSIKQVNRKRIQKIFSTGLLQQFAFCSSPPTIQTEATPMPHLSWLAKSSSLASSSQLSSQTFTVVSSTPFDSASEKKLINQQEFCMHAFVFHYFERFRNIVLFMGKIVHNLLKMLLEEGSTTDLPQNDTYRLLGIPRTHRPPQGVQDPPWWRSPFH